LVKLEINVEATRQGMKMLFSSLAITLSVPTGKTPNFARIYPIAIKMKR
jgi:hypothetical protein